MKSCPSTTFRHIANKNVVLPAAFILPSSSVIDSIATNGGTSHRTTSSVSLAMSAAVKKRSPAEGSAGGTLPFGVFNSAEYLVTPLAMPSTSSLSKGGTHLARFSIASASVMASTVNPPRRMVPAILNKLLFRSPWGMTSAIGLVVLWATLPARHAAKYGSITSS